MKGIKINILKNSKIGPPINPGACMRAGAYRRTPLTLDKEYLKTLNLVKIVVPVS